MISVGWDIGGAHIKVCVAENQNIMAIYQEPCPLWQGLDKLENAVQKLLQQIPNLNAKHAITMTGELVDLFKNRRDGVKQILQTMSQLLGDTEIHIFCGKSGLFPIFEINENHFDAIASANWLASASFAAKKFENCLFVDVGSTTTDILWCENGDVLAQGFSDYERLISQELIYTGIVRTAVMSVVQTVLDNQKYIGVMAEHFATMSDVYRLTGELSENHDQTPTADGAEKTLEASARRLSRMLGDDFKSEELTRWQAMALDIRKQQIQRIQKGCELQLNKKTTFVGAGIGRFLVQEIAENLNCVYVDFSTLFSTNQTLIFEPADCAPAVAVALLF